MPVPVSWSPAPLALSETMLAASPRAPSAAALTRPPVMLMTEPPVPKVLRALLSTSVPAPLLVMPKPPETTPVRVSPWTIGALEPPLTLKVAAPDNTVVPVNSRP